MTRRMNKKLNKEFLKERSKSKVSKVIPEDAPPPLKPASRPAPGGSLFSTLADGMFFGAGSGIGHQIVNSFTGNKPKIEPTNVNNCDELREIYHECKNTHGFCNEVQSNYLTCLERMENYREIKKN